MNTLRLVKDGAKPQLLKIGELPWEKGKLGGNIETPVYPVSDTIPISSPWTDDEAAVLCGKLEWDIIYDWYDEWLCVNLWEEKEVTFVSYLHELISLSIAHEKSGLSLEQFIEGMATYV
ncbi:MAG: hypothetical protein PHY28_04400 [Dehalococcoidales bacterium]|nr:hypothetical protein [Dehalococcoidales bacterium]